MTSANPASRAHAFSRRPAAGSPVDRPVHPQIDVEPLIERRQPRVPDDALVVDIAHRDHATGRQHAAELAQRVDRAREVLQHLMGVDDVVSEPSGRSRAYASPTTNVDVRRRPRSAARAEALCDDVGRGIHAPSRGLGRRARARSTVIVPGPAPDVEQRLARAEGAASRYAAEFATVRHSCDRSTLSW